MRFGPLLRSPREELKMLRELGPVNWWRGLRRLRKWRREMLAWAKACEVAPTRSADHIREHSDA